MTYTYRPRGVCSTAMTITVDDGVITDVDIKDGCAGNLLGIKALAIGQRAADVIDKFKDIRCGRKATSCPAQLAAALQETLAQEEPAPLAE